jgi:hypothetical protein
MTDAQARAHVWTLCLAALVLCALTGPIAAVLAPLVHDSSLALNVVAAVLAAALVGAYVAVAVLLIVAVLRVVRPHLDGHR